jgi:hypothetical protein
MNELKPSPVLLCANCTAELKGEFCHDCGQSIQSVIRPVSHMLEDAGDLFFHLDERIIHTLPPLYLKPGYLTLEYFSGRRVRYIAPFRLMFVFGLLALFFLHLALNGTNIGTGKGEKDIARDNVAAYAAAKTPDAVRTLYTDQKNELHQMLADPATRGLGRMGVAMTADVMRGAANARLAELKAEPLPADLVEVQGDDDRENSWGTWVKGESHVDIAWLPAMANHRLDQALDQFKANAIKFEAGGDQRKEAVRRIIEGFFGVLPQTMFFMIPVFALVLKLFYAFRRRLYMEHIIVALHSHAFIFISLMGLTLLGFARAAIQPHVNLAASAIGVIQTLMWVWIPVYLLIMQKRIYRQGWVMTIVKYGLIGSVYFWLLLFAVTIAAAIGLAH